MELHWAPGYQLYITPVGKEVVCVVLISRTPSLRLDQALHAFPEACERLQNCEISSLERGAETVTRKLSRVFRGNVALIGDASGGVDAITGEGLCLAFKQAEALADSVEVGDLSVYQSAHRRLSVRPANMARLMLRLENRDWLRRRAMQAFIRHPQLFAGMLATHVGSSTALDIATDGLALGWRLLTA
jgi:flavin-dependent dehydrogenase